MKRFLSGDEAFAEGVRLARPQGISAYPITPQTVVVERLSEMVEDGSLAAEYVHVESEHSALSCAIGASATGARTFTATSSQGLLYMAECLTYAAGGRFPIVMMNANRATALPWNIYGDQRDSLALLDHGWIQVYAEDNQEALDLALMAYAVAENPAVATPVMVNLDGFALTHTYETVDVPEPAEADAFLPPYEPAGNRFDFEHPVNIGFSAGPEYNRYFKYWEHRDMLDAPAVVTQVEQRFAEVFGRQYPGMIETLDCDDADVILATGIILALLGLVPGAPTAPLLLVGCGLGIGGFLSDRKLTEQKALEEQPAPEAAATPELQAASETDYFKDINNVYSLLAVEPIEMEFGYSLIPLVDEKSGGKLISRIVIFRRQYAQDMGFVIPSIRLHDGAALGTNQYVIKIRGEEVARGEILVDYYLALEPSNPAGTIDGIETVEPAYGIPSRWILPENKEMAEIYGYTVITPLTVMLTHLSETIKKHAYELLNRSETLQLVENLKKTEPELVADVIPNVISYANLEKILRSLLREGIPIRDLAAILEAVVEASTTTHDIDMITEQVRGALGRTITRKFCENGQLRVVTLDAELEKKVLAALTKNEHGVYLALSPDIVQQIVQQVGELRKKFEELSQTPILLTSQIIRVYLSRMLATFYPDIYVLSFNEITSNVQIQAIGNITLQPQEKRA